eukprot:CAMPEP_0201500466 /NCGR_PEP_ID=MMETSP0151_2-20130828/81656_1 /ASSEMBLY_ACC=CAM_ASM_000257 /TAXON_ID=200890 /ORGANISM="Paramoeba atlantica, Strain 621/1 / CCAP 1560/9" /LENGTH=86 /DNA_ID=CAMNT_0047893703 /DNA_START=319 /DNA_END=576 /DNA_ORIENTATION=-
MGVHNNIGGETRGGEGHVLGPGGDPDRALLAVAGAELVPDIGDTGGTGFDFVETVGASQRGGGLGEENGIDGAVFGDLGGGAVVFF